jgi:hypothetical protein
MEAIISNITDVFPTPGSPIAIMFVEHGNPPSCENNLSSDDTPIGIDSNIRLSMFNLFNLVICEKSITDGTGVKFFTFAGRPLRSTFTSLFSIFITFFLFLIYTLIYEFFF